MTNVRYFLDTEFNSFGGSLISLGICREESDDNLYVRVPDEDIERMRFEEGMDPWIEKNILPILDDTPDDANFFVLPVHQWGDLLSQFIYRDGEVPHVFVDWPSDAMDFARLLMTGPGQAVDMGNQTIITILRHVDIYPTTVPGAVQHNALWDAMAIRQFVKEMTN